MTAITVTVPSGKLPRRFKWDYSVPQYTDQTAIEKGSHTSVAALLPDVGDVLEVEEPAQVREGEEVAGLQAHGQALELQQCLCFAVVQLALLKKERVSGRQLLRAHVDHGLGAALVEQEPADLAPAQRVFGEGRGAVRGLETITRG